MTTAQAATIAGVTPRTIRRWCCAGKLAATKRGRAWVIDSTSVQERSSVTEVDKFVVEEDRNERGTVVYKVVRSDGGQDWRGDTHYRRERAEFQARVLSGLPDGFHCRLRQYPARSMSRGCYWEVTGSIPGDPRTFHAKWDEGKPLPEGNPMPSVEAHLIRQAEIHVDGSAKRIQEAAEAEAIAAAEQAVRDARAAHLAEIARQKGPLATPRQVEFIMQLLDYRQRTGEGGGFFDGPTTRAGVEELSKAEASLYIDSLKGNY